MYPKLYDDDRVEERSTMIVEICMPTPATEAPVPDRPDPPELARVKLQAAIAKEQADTAASQAKRLQSRLPSQVKALEGTTKLEGDPIECQILAYQQVNKLATEIGTAIMAIAVKPTKIVIYSESEINLVLGLKAFKAQLTLAKDRLKAEIENAKAAITTAELQRSTVATGFVASLASLPLGAGGAIRAAADLVSLFKVDETIKYKDLTIPDVSLAAAVAAALIKQSPSLPVYHSSIIPPDLLKDSATLLATLSSLSDLRSELDESQPGLARMQAKLKAKIDKLTTKIAADVAANKDTSKDQASLDREQGAHDLLSAATARAQASAASYDAFALALLKADETTGSNGLARILRAEKLAAAAAGAHWLVLKVAAAGGGYKTKHWLWWPTTKVVYSGGAIVQFMLFNDSGKIDAAGVLPKYSGFIKVTDQPTKTADLA